MKQIKARRAARPAKTELNPRNLVLAGLGVAVIARREGRSLLARIDARGRRLAERVQREAGAAGGRAAELVDQVRNRIEQVSQPVIARVETLLGRTAKAKGKPTAKRAAKKRTRRA